MTAVAAIATVAVTSLVLTAPAASSRRPARSIGGAQLRSSSHASANALALQADGKLVVAGWSDAAAPAGAFALARYTRSGGLDTSFGRGGKVLTDFGSFRGATAVAIQPDGKIVAAGWSSRSADRRDTEFALARYRRDGSLDASFGRGGKALTSFGRYSGAAALAMQRDGKLVVAGDSSTPGGTSHLALARYTRKGTLDPSFGRGGRVLASFSSSGEAVAIQSDGKFVVACRGGSHGRFVLVRYSANGALDPSFGQGGTVSTRVDNSWSDAYALAIQVDRKIVVVGGADFTHFALARYMTDGSLDESFGSGGTVLTRFALSQDDDSSDVATAVAIQAEGKLVVVGWSDALGNHGEHPNTANRDFALARYTSAGILDTSFGRRGKVLTSFDIASTWESMASGVVIQPDGTIVAAGSRGVATEGPRDFLLRRYGARGRLDGSFGRGGKVTTNFGSR